MNIYERFMQRALDLATKGEGRVEPNPLVGAVLVKNGRVIGQGYHKYFGGLHAEINALKSARSRSFPKRTGRGATLYINLEPCAHYGKTPPCVDAIIRAGIKKVVIATRDPNPITSRRGVQVLKKAGIKVIEGVSADKARRLNAPFFKLHRQGLPYIIAKWAMSLDGKIATRTGDSQWISSPASRTWLRQIREKVGALMVGIRTVLADDPRLLAVRTDGSPIRARRIILDARARTPLGSRIIKTIRAGPEPITGSGRAETWIVVSPSAPKKRVEKLRKAGCKILEVSASNGKLNLIKLARKIAESGINKVMIEGGGEVMASAFKAGLVDEVLIFIGPKIIGGRLAKTPVEGSGIDRIKQAINLDEITFQRINNDLVIRGLVTK